jgi:hypothetical protein
MWISRIQGDQTRSIDAPVLGSVIEKRGWDQRLRFYPHFLLLSQQQSVRAWVYGHRSSCHFPFAIGAKRLRSCFAECFRRVLSLTALMLKARMILTLRSFVLYGDVAEQADAKVSKTFKGNLVWVRFPPSPPNRGPAFGVGVPFNIQTNP